MTHMHSPTERERAQRALSAALQEIRSLKAELQTRREPIALVGAGCRFPGNVGNLEEYWQLLLEGRDTAAEIPRERWEHSEYYSENVDEPGKTYARHGSFITDYDLFDPQFFGLSPREAVEIDPQQRLLLECSWRAVEDAGTNPEAIRGTRCAVYVGVSMDDYAQRSVASRDVTRINAYTSLGNAKSLAAGRIAYVLDLRGPTLQLDTTCSSSLLAIHLACQALKNGECDAALAGGVNLMLSPNSTIGFSSLRALSPSGRCRTFDSRADGYLRGEGCGMVYLKRLSDARKSGDRVIAVVRASGVNHDGRSNGITAPNGAAQAELISGVWSRAGIGAEDIGYLEAHGTGTQLGDPIELAAIHQAKGSSSGVPLWVGSVKTNIGHLEAAAGVAAFLKAALIVQRGEIPPHLHFREPNPHFSWSESRLCVPVERVPFPAVKGPRRAGINAYGMSGTNVHVVVESTNDGERIDGTSEDVGEFRRIREAMPIRLSADDEDSLRQLSGELVAAIEDLGENANLEEIAWTLLHGRPRRKLRRTFCISSKADLVTTLRGIQSGIASSTILAQCEEPKRLVRPRFAFLMSGQGSQYAGMGLALMGYPEMRRTLSEASEILAEILPRPLLEVLGDEEVLQETRSTQPALLAVQVGLLRMLETVGIVPSIVLGHSVGEFAAAVAAGVLSFEEACRLVAVRGRVVFEQPRGAMLAVSGAAQSLVRLRVPPGIELAVCNTEEQRVFAGSHKLIQRFHDELKSQPEFRVALLRVSHAFHSAAMEGAIAPLEREASKCRFDEPSCIYISSMTGTRVADELREPAYWGAQLRKPVRFEEALNSLTAHEADYLLELGGKPTLCGFAQRAVSGSRLVSPVSLPGKESESFSQLLLQLEERGVPVAWDAWGSSRGLKKVSLPGTPFSRQSYLRLFDRESGEVGLGGFQLRQVPSDEGALLQGVCSASHMRFVREHLVHGKIVVPAAGHLSAVAEAARMLGHRDCILRDVVFPHALILGGGEERPIRVFFNTTEERFEVSSQGADGRWSVHAEGQFEWRPGEDDDWCTEEFDASCFRPWDLDVYAHQAKNQIELGPSFHFIHDVRVGERRCCARLDAPDVDECLRWENLHPGLIDSAFQLLGATAEVRGTFIPWQIAYVRLTGGPTPRRMLGFARSAEPNDQRQVGDVSVKDESGQVRFAVQGLEARQISPAALLSAASAPAPYLWQLQKEAQGLTLEELPVQGRPSFILTGAQSEFLGQLEQAAGVTSLPEPGAVLKRLGRESSGPVSLVLAWDEEGGDAGEPACVMQWLDVVRSWVESQREKSGGVLQFVVACEEGERLRCPAAAALWAALGCLAHEEPSLIVRRLAVEKVSEAVERCAAALCGSVQSSGTFQLQRGDSWGRRLEPVRRVKVWKPSSRSTYVVTGGLGGLGGQIVRWLADEGVGNILVIGRRAPSEVAGRVRELGVPQLEYLAFGSGDETEATALRQKLAQWPPLAGIFHAAGALADATFANVSVEALERCWHPKVDLCEFLLRALGPLKPRFILGISSITAVLGSGGQSSYAAANAAMSAVLRRADDGGIPASCVVLGPLDNLGMTAGLGAQREARIRASGLGLLSAEEALRGIEDAVGRLLEAKADSRERLVARLDQERLGSSLPEMLGIGTGGKRVSPFDRRDLESSLIRLVAGVLRLSESQVKTHVPLVELGMDSLMTLEVRQELEKGLGLRLPLQLLLEHPSIEELIPALREKVEGEPQTLELASTVGATGEVRTVSLSTLREGMPGHRHLVLIHGVDGGLEVFEDLVRAAPRDWRVSGLSRKPSAHVTVSQLARDYCGALPSDGSDAILAGWSFGGLISLEMGRLLKARPKVVALDTFTDFRFRQEATVAELVRTVRCLVGMLGIGEIWSEERLTALPSKKRLSSIWKEVEEMELPLSSERRQLFFAHLRAMLEHESDPYPDEVLWVRSETMIEGESPTNTPHQIAPAALVRVCPFGHRSMLEGEAATRIMKEIQQYVEGGIHA